MGVSETRRRLRRDVGELCDTLARNMKQEGIDARASFNDGDDWRFTDEWRVRLTLPYCDSSLVWDCIIDASSSQLPPDLELQAFPGVAGDKVDAKGFWAMQQGVYFSHEPPPSLIRWDVRRKESLQEVAKDLLRMCKDHHRSKLRATSLQWLDTQLADFDPTLPQPEVLVLDPFAAAGPAATTGVAGGSSSSVSPAKAVRIVLPVLTASGSGGDSSGNGSRGGSGGGSGGGSSSTAGKEEEGEGDDDLDGPELSMLGDSIQMRLEFTSPMLSTAYDVHPDIRVSVPASLPVTRAGLRPPPWPTSESLAELVESARRAVLEPWRRRRQLVAALARRYAVLEYDAADYGMAFLLVRAVRGRRAFVRILRIELKNGFPEAPPTMTVLDALGKQAWDVDPRDVRYSPRWEPDRMAEGLYSHAMRVITAEGKE